MKKLLAVLLLCAAPAFAQTTEPPDVYPPEGVTEMEYALFNLLNAVEDIAIAMEEKEKDK